MEEHFRVFRSRIMGGKNRNVPSASHSEGSYSLFLDHYSSGDDHSAHWLDQNWQPPLFRDHKREKAKRKTCKISRFYTTQQAVIRPLHHFVREASNFRVGTDPFTQ